MVLQQRRVLVEVGLGDVARCRSRSPRGSGPSGTRRTRSRSGRRRSRRSRPTGGCRTPRTRPCRPAGCRPGTGPCTCRGCCRRSCCRPARWRRTSAGRRRSGSSRRARRTGSGCRRRCRCARGGRRRRRRPPCSGTVHVAETPQLPQSTIPVACAVRHAGWLRAVDRHAGGDLARAVAAVVAQAQDVEVVGGRGVDLEADRLPDVDAHLRREALDGGVAVAGDLPVGRGRAGLGVLARDRVGHGRRAGVRGGMAARGQQGERGRGSDEARGPAALRWAWSPSGERTR